MAGVAGKAHQLPGHRRDQMAAVEGILLAAVGRAPLVPGQAGTRLDPGRRGFAHLVLEDFAVTGQALLVARALDGWFEMDGIVGGTLDAPWSRTWIPIRPPARAAAATRKMMIRPTFGFSMVSPCVRRQDKGRGCRKGLSGWDDRTAYTTHPGRPGSAARSAEGRSP